MLEFFPTAELHLPWKSPSALLYLLFHSPCDNIEDGRQHFPVHISNSLFLLVHFQAAPWAGSQTSPQEGHQGLSQPHECLSWASHSALPPPSTSSSHCLCSETCCGAGNFSRWRAVGFQQGYAAAQTFMLWVLPQSLVSPAIDANHLIDLCIWDNKASIFLYRLLWFNYKILRTKQAMKCSCCAEWGRLCPSFSMGAWVVLQAEGWVKVIFREQRTCLFRKRLMQKCYRADSAIGSCVTVLAGPAGECCVCKVPQLRKYHDGQGFCFLPEMQRLGFPQCV